MIFPELLDSDLPPMHPRALSDNDGDSTPVEHILGDIWTVSEMSKGNVRTQVPRD